MKITVAGDVDWTPARSVALILQTKTHVHPSTLKAFVKERITDGKPIDLDMFGAFISNAAQIRRKA